MISTLAVAAFLITHGAIHSAFLAPPPPATAGGPAWPFEMDRSWLLGRFGLPPTAGRAIGGLLIAVTIGAFSFAALVSLVVAPANLWAAAVAIGAIASLGVLAMYSAHCLLWA